MRNLLILILLGLPLIASAQVYRCETPNGPLYQNRPCEDRTQQRLLEDNISVIPRGPHGTVQPRQYQQPRQSAGSVGGIMRQDNPASENAACPALRRELQSIDNAARQRSTQWLTDRRRSVRAQMYDLRCKEIGPTR